MKKLDKINRQILNELQENSSITNSELALKLKIPATTVFDRVKKLEQNGIISKRVAIVNPENVGKETIVFVSLSLNGHSAKNVQKFWRAIKSLPEVLECYHVSGDYDFILKIMVDNIRVYESFLLEKLTAIENIGKIKTSFVMSTIKYQTKIPI
ncbi:MAG: Lrp/AsnC family transcriptional regulator [Melioribacteraceae bacterium]|nr:Lrp/AsnC family transcriptional regulator [Melioribacteraceae bacterium]